MSFNLEVHKELCSGTSFAEHCLLSELSAIINSLCETSPSYIMIATENKLAAERFALLVNKLFDFSVELVQKKQIFMGALVDSLLVGRVLKATGTFLRNNPSSDIDPLTVTVMGNCCKRAYIRGSFIAGGVVSNPEKTYHMEFTLPAPPIGLDIANNFIYLLRSFNLRPKSITRKTHVTVYIKEAENIVDALNIMGAHNSLMKLENVRVFKEVRGWVNRQVNFEAANITKTIGAAIGQIEDINYIADNAGLDCLSKPLEEVARLRLNYQEASLKEIGEMLDVPVSKSGINHRLRKISEIAANLRDNTKNEVKNA